MLFHKLSYKEQVEKLVTQKGSFLSPLPCVAKGDEKLKYKSKIIDAARSTLPYRVPCGNDIAVVKRGLLLAAKRMKYSITLVFDNTDFSWLITELK